jgi:hypothetical protein
MITGSVSTVVWSEIAVLDQAVSVRFASFVIAFAAVVLVSLMTKNRKETVA